MEEKMEWEEYEEKYQKLTSEEQENAAIELVKSILLDQDQVSSSVIPKMVDIHLIQNYPDTEYYEIIPLQRQIIVEHYSYEEFLIKKKK